MQKRLNVLSIVLASVSFALFFTMLIMVLSKCDFYIDSFNDFVALNRTEFLNKFLKYFTFIGTFYFLALICLISFLLLFFKLKKRRLAVFTLSCFTVASILNVILKNIVKRIRPDKFSLVNELGFSFPSWHAMMSTVMFGLVIYFVLKFVTNKPLKICLTILNVLVIVLIGFSRIYLGVHYLSDVIAGILIGFSVLMVFILIYNSKAFNKLKD